MSETLNAMTHWVSSTLLRDGGQRGARRNAWRAMVDDAARARERAEVEVSLQRLAGNPPGDELAQAGRGHRSCQPLPWL